MSPETVDFCTIEEALHELRQGRMIVLVDDPQRENEGDLVLAAEKATPEAINFMLRNACGNFCLAMSPTICDRLNLDIVPGANADMALTPLTLKIDARTGVTTGVSAFDRARTIQVAIDENSTPADLKRGHGHTDALRGRAGGVLVRAGHTEGSIDLARLAGFKEAAVICEVLKADGHMARLPDLRVFCEQHDLKMCTIEDLIKYRRQREKLIRRETAVQLPTRFGDFDLIAYTSVVDPEPHLALCKGGVGVEIGGAVPVQEEPILVRIHSQCLTGDIFESKLCDCGSQLHQAMQQVSEAGKGVVLYMRQEGRGIGLLSKLQAYKLQQDERWAGHRRGQPAFGFRARPAPLRHRRPDPDRPRRAQDASADEQPQEGGRRGRLWPPDCGAGADPDRAQSEQPALLAHQEGEARPPARRPGDGLNRRTAARHRFGGGGPAIMPEMVLASTNSSDSTRHFPFDRSSTGSSGPTSAVSHKRV